jgi:acetyl/propionyl-CoA carboxylase alpha subunit
MKLKGDFQGQEWRAEAQIVKGQMWVHVNGRTFAIESEAKRSARRGGGKSKSGDIPAPMPGKVTKLLKQKGDAVKAGEAVLVMEAMKMEYTLKAEVAGSIEVLQCAVGDQVTLGKILVKVKPEAGEAGKT